MTSKKAASLSSALLARKGSAVPAGLSDSPATAGAPLPGLLNADIEHKNGNGNDFRPISLEPPCKPNRPAKLGCDDPLQPPLIPGLATQTVPKSKTGPTVESKASPDVADSAKPAGVPEQPSQKLDTAQQPKQETAQQLAKPEPAPTAIKAAAPLRPKAPAQAEPVKEQEYPQPPKPRATPTQAAQTLVAERRARPETAASAARLAAAAAGKTVDPMPGPAIAAIATVVVLAVAGAGYLFFSDSHTTAEVAQQPPAADAAPAAKPVTTVAETSEAPPAAAVTPTTTDSMPIAVAARTSQPIALPAPRPTTAIEPISQLAATGPLSAPLADAASVPGDSEAGSAAAVNDTIVAAAETTEPLQADPSVDGGPLPAPRRPAATADTGNIIPTAASTAPLPAPKPERIAALSNAAGGSGGGRFAVQLASVPSAAAAQREIRRLRRIYPTLFGEMTIDVQRGRGSYRLMSQRFEDRGDAANLCQSLKDAGRGCLILAR